MLVQCRPKMHHHQPLLCDVCIPVCGGLDRALGNHKFSNLPNVNGQNTSLMDGGGGSCDEHSPATLPYKTQLHLLHHNKWQPQRAG